MGHIAITTFQPAAGGLINRKDIPIDRSVVAVRNVLTHPKVCRVPKQLREVFSRLLNNGEVPAMAHIVTRNAVGVEKGKTIILPKHEAQKLQLLVVR